MQGAGWGVCVRRGERRSHEKLQRFSIGAPTASIITTPIPCIHLSPTPFTQSHRAHRRTEVVGLLGKGQVEHVVDLVA